jgi:hypothetical protein
MNEIINEGIQNSFNILIRIWLWLIIGLFLSGIIRALVSERKISSYLRKMPGGTNFAIFVTAIIGATIPICSCRLIPLLMILLASNVSIGIVMAFIICSPMIGITSFILIYGTISPKFGLSAYIGAIIIGTISGIIAGKIFNKKDVKWHQTEKESSRGSFISIFLKYTKNQSIRLLKIFLPFIFIAGFLEALVSERWVMLIFGKGIPSIIIGALLGLPLYITSTSGIPLIIAMLNKGMSESVGIAFLLSGAGTSIPAIGATASLLKSKLVAYYICSCILGAIFVGIIYGL